MQFALDPKTLAQIVSIAAAIGLVWPFVQALIQRPGWSPKVKMALNIGAAVVFGTASYIVQNGFNVANVGSLLAWIASVYSFIVVFYTGLKKSVDHVEANAGNTDTGFEQQPGQADELPADPYSEDGVNGDNPDAEPDDLPDEDTEDAEQGPALQ